MAATGYTPISLYYSTTASAVPTSGNLANGELALNIADMKLYAKNSAGTVTLLASNASTTGVDSLSFGSTGLTPSTASTGAITVAGTLNVANGGTGLTSLTANRIPYGNGTSALQSSSLLTFDGSQLLVNSNSTTASGFFQINDATTTQANSFGTIVRNANDGNGRYSLSAWRAQNASGLTQYAYIGAQSISGASNYTPELVFGLSTGASTYAEQVRLNTTGLAIGTTSVVQKLTVAGAMAATTNSGTANTNYATFGLYTGGAIPITYIQMPSGGATDFWKPDTGTAFRIGSAGQFGVGTNYGTAGQVLTSGGSGSAPTWATAASGAQAFVAFGTVGGYGGF